MANVALLTILPTPSQGTRYIQQDLVDWIQAAGHHVTARKKFFINVTFAESSLDAESEFRAALMSIGRDAEVLLMDMSYSTDLGRFYGHFDMLAAEALATCNFEIAILLFDAAPWRDDAITKLASLTNHNPEIAVHALSAGWLVPNRFTLDLAAPPNPTKLTRWMSSRTSPSVKEAFSGPDIPSQRRMRSTIRFLVTNIANGSPA